MVQVLVTGDAIIILTSSSAHLMSSNK